MGLDSQLPEPRDYFLGATSHSPLLADNILIFGRSNDVDLRGKSQESSPHRRYVLCFCLETAGSVFVDHKRIDLVPQTAVLIPPFHFHYYDHLESSQLSWVFITFDSKSTSELLTAVPLFFSVNPQLMSDLEGLCQLSQNQVEASDQGHFIVKTNAFLYDLLRSAPEKAAPKKKTFSLQSVSWAERVQNELQKDPGASLNFLATQLGYSEGHLRHLFKESQNMSLNDYVNHYRLHWAINHLREPHVEILDISEQLGFSSQASFTRFFRRMTNTTPARYRRSLG